MTRRRRVATRAADVLVAGASALTRRHYLPLEYPPAARDEPRWGHGRPGHAALEAMFARDHATWEGAIDVIVACVEGLAQIPDNDDRQSSAPKWNPGNLPGLDGAALYAFTRTRKPTAYVEIGSGNSTKFVAQAIRDGGLATTITSIDPHPRAEIDALCDVVIRQPLESVDLTLFDGLQAGDVVFFDGSHRSFMNSDVTVFFLDVLPRLPVDVLIGIHDIELPDDYSPMTAHRYWSEQYILAAYLLGGHQGTRVAFPAAYVAQQPELQHRLAPLWQQLPLVETHGGAFWLETTAA